VAPFYDSTNPLAIPEGSLAAWYGAGDFTTHVTEALKRRFAGHILISNMPRDAAAAAACRVLDVETGAASAADAPDFVDIRRAHGHEDSTIYMQLSTVPAVVAALGSRRPRLWVAWWREPAATRDEIVAALLELYKLRIAPERIWAVQWHGAPTAAYDSDELFGVDDFVR
jgi:hypothetical protein